MKLRETSTKSWVGDLGIGIVNAVNAALGRQKSVSQAPQSGDGMMRTLRWKRPLALMIDEVQNLERREFRLLEEYHLGTHGCPIVPIFAGLGNSREVLRGNGFSRMTGSSMHSLGYLEQGGGSRGGPPHADGVPGDNCRCRQGLA